MKKYTWRNPVQYIKDNPEGYWFKAKLYGFGWTPASWQGWLVTCVALVIIVLDALWLSTLGDAPVSSELIVFFTILLVTVLFLVGVSFWKGERPRWYWGR